jgi:hypothetical protein
MFNNRKKIEIKQTKNCHIIFIISLKRQFKNLAKSLERSAYKYRGVEVCTDMYIIEV